jgi:Transposase zinc-binding domain
MSAIQNCRTAALGGHVDGCDDCGYLRIAYNSCLMCTFRNGELACWPSRLFCELQRSFSP